MTSPQHKPNVIFLRVRSPQEKIVSICKTMSYLFNSGNTILIHAPSADAAQYVNDLLWRYPEDSFLPHSVESTPTNERIVITTAAENLNQAQVLFNLCTTVGDHCLHFEKIYELQDETDPNRLQLSKQKYNIYKERQFPVSMED